MRNNRSNFKSLDPKDLIKGNYSIKINNNNIEK